jgi:hypothetical protein
MTKQKVLISDILQAEKWRKRINSYDLEAIDFIDEDGKLVVVDTKIIEDFRFSGLHNIDFITTEFYKTGFDK